MGARRRVSLAPLLGVNSTRVADRVLGGTYMRGGYNVELRDGEWWSRCGERENGTLRMASTPWWWVQRINPDLEIVANPWWALEIASSGEVTSLYTAAISENVAFTNNSATATSSTTRVVDQLILANGGAGLPTTAVYRVVARTGTTMTLDRPYEGSTTAALSCDFIDPLARNAAGTAVPWTTARAWQLFGSAVVFEQLVTHAGTSLGWANPATTAGRLYLIITCNFGVPVAIDLSSVSAPLRLFFYNTSLATPTQIGAATATGEPWGYGTVAEVYKNRLFIGPAADGQGLFPDRTLWWSQQGDFLQWHTGIQGQTAAPNFKTFDGEGDVLCDLKVLRDDLVVHRDVSQVMCSISNSPATPFLFRTNSQGVGVGDATLQRTNRVVLANATQFIWTGQGPAIFDGQVRPIAQEAARALAALNMRNGRGLIGHVVHDTARQRIYWWSGRLTRQQDALPATATITSAGGHQYQNYRTCFVYDYGTGAFWLEDRPASIGGGIVKINDDSPVAHVSRLDGTLVKLVDGESSNSVADASHLTPDDSDDDVAVNWRVETPWLDFGNPAQKQLQRVEVTARVLTTGEHPFDDYDTSLVPSDAWMRCQVYADKNEATARADVGVEANTESAAAAGEYNQAPTLILDFTPRAHGMVHKLVFSNVLTSAATTAGYDQSGVRIADIVCEVADRQGTSPLGIGNDASISE